PNAYRFGGRLGYYRDIDAETCLLRLRYYDPTLQRFLTPDPIMWFQPDDRNDSVPENRVSGSVVPTDYQYATNNPIGFVDPSGRVSVFFDGAGQTENTRSIIYRLYLASTDPKRDYVKIAVFFDPTQILKDIEKKTIDAVKFILDAVIA